MNWIIALAEPDDRIPGVIILAGTTASGKTEVSVPLARLLNAEIINADSRQVYRELKIGTAPPSPEQLAEVTHHFVASRSLRERWTAGDFSRSARELIERLTSSGKRTLVVGGSMLYLRALTDGLYESGEEPDLDYAALRKEWDTRGSASMYAELTTIDPALAARTQATDHHRILRALGVWRRAGKRLSELRAESTSPLAVRYTTYFLHGDREETYARVNHRVDDMLANGLVEEVRSLFEAGFDETNCNALRTHGYQEVFPYLRGECEYETMREQIRKAVRHYVKRQMTWFRRVPGVIWVKRSFTEPAATVAHRIFLDASGERPLPAN